MKAIIFSDPQRGAGHAIVRLEGCSAASSGAFSLRRGSDMKFLASGGWQESEMLLTPDCCEMRDGHVCLSIGPSVVDQLDPLAAYLITVDGQRFGVEMSPLEYSSLGGQAGAMPVPPQAPSMPVEPEPEPVAPEAPLTEPEPAPPVQPEAPSDSAPEQLDMGEATPVRRRPVWPLILGVLALLAVAGGAAWYFLGQDKAAETPPLPVQEAPVPASPEAPAAEAPEASTPPETPAVPDDATKKPSADSADTAGTATPAPSVEASPMQKARDHLRGQADPATSVALARPLRTPDVQPQDADAAFLLLEDAAQKGNAEAMFLSGQFYDPACTLPRGSIVPDMGMARTLYESARAAGVTEAEAALGALRRHAEAEAAKGNADARALLRDWK